MGLLTEIWKTYLDIAPYLFLGLVFAGMLHVVFKKDFVVRHLGKNNFFSVIKAAVLGVPLPLCSCGVIPTAIFLRKKKASKGATLSFLISTPQTGVDSIIATYGMMGPIFAIFRPIAAFVTGIIGGVVTNFIEQKEEIVDPLQNDKFECDTCEVKEPHSHTILERIISGFTYAFGEFLDDISLQLIVGILIASFISFVVPDNFFANYGGEGFVGMLIMIAVGIPLYVCATASIPIAVSLILKGISPGAAFVFLVVGPATNAATITLIANALGRKMVSIYLSVIAIFAIGFGFLLNWIFDLLGDSADITAMHHSHGTAWYVYMLMGIFSVLLAMSLYRRIKPHSPSPVHQQQKHDSGNDFMENIKKFEIVGMTCNHCAANVKNAIQEVANVDNVEINLAEKNAVVKGDFSQIAVIEAIKSVGFSVK